MSEQNGQGGQAIFIPEGDVPATSQINFLSGSFEVGAWRIPYFSTTMTFREAANDLRLTNEMPGAHKVQWTVSELYQRDIDWNRVQNELLRYLTNTAQPQFFNALTVALFPYGAPGADEHAFSTTAGWTAPALTGEENYARTLEVGPVKFGFYYDWQTVNDPGFMMGRMRWNTDQVHGVAIDGQHRLASIKEYVRRNKGVTNSRIPVLLLLLDPAVGFEAPEDPEMTSVMRRLFIDLNKHSRPVSRARTILLDDRDPISRCVRAFLSNELAADFASLSAQPPRMPLALVDWHSEEAKFDKGPYLATVLGIDWAVALLLGHKPLSDMTNYTKIDQQIRSFSHRLNIDVTSMLERLDENRERLVPFSFSEDELEEIKNGFAAVWNGPMVHLLTEYKPYKEFVSLRQVDSSQGLEWQMWYRLNHAARTGAAHSVNELDEFLQELSFAQPPIYPAKLEACVVSHEAFKRENLAFNVAFQRAYFQAFAHFYNFTDADLGQFELWAVDDEFDLDDVEEFVPPVGDDGEIVVADDDEFEPTEDPVEGDHREAQRAHVFVRLMNRLLEVFPSMLRVDARLTAESGDKEFFWSGTLRKADSGIDFAQGASVRAGDLLYLCVGIAALDEVTKGSELPFEDVWAELVDGSEWGPFKKMNWASRRLWEKEASMAGRILAARDEAFTKVASQQEIELRLGAIWKLLRT